MTVLIVASTRDPAGMNIAEKLVRKFGFREPEELLKEGRSIRNEMSFLHTQSVTPSTLAI